MAAGDLVPFQLTSATHTTEILGAQSAEVSVGDVRGEDPGPADAAGGPALVVVQKQRIDVVVYGTDPNSLRAHVNTAAADLVLVAKGAAGASETHTLKNVVFTSFVGPIRFRAPGGGGQVPMWGISGTAEWGAEDTLATMWTTA